MPDSDLAGHMPSREFAGSPRNEGFVVGIDTGGTFTDIVVLHPDGEVTINKSPTTPQDLAQGVFGAVEVAAASLGLSTPQFLARTAMFKHGTTVATNAMITRRGSKVGLITTRGFEDTVYVMRAIGRVDGLDEMEIKHVSKVTKPDPPGRRAARSRASMSESTTRARSLVPLDRDGVRAALRELVDHQGVDAIAVCFLFSWMNPAHENAVAEIVRELYPDRPLSITAVAPHCAADGRIRPHQHHHRQQLPVEHHRPLRLRPEPAAQARPASRTTSW